MKSGKSLVELATEIQRRSEAKKDFVASTKDIALNADDEAGVRMTFGDQSVAIGRTAHDQIAVQADIPKKYYDRMLREAPQLLASNVNTWFADKPAKRMIRTLDGQARALLSDRYRPLENENLAEAVLPVIGSLGLDIMSAEITDRRLYIKAVDPKVTRELAKQGAAFGDGGHTIVRMLSPALTISNSEIGDGALSVLAGTYDGFCSNLATFGGRSMRKYHIGGKHEIGDEVYAMLSDNTRRITDAALWAQVTDVVKNAFDRLAFDELVNEIEGTKADRIDGDPVKAVDLSAKRFGFNDGERNSILKHLIEGADLSRFGLHNAITRASQDVADYDRATELERIGGQVIELKRNDWADFAMAA